MIEYEQQLLKRINAIIDRNLDNTNFQLSDITEGLEISRAKLYRKTVKLTSVVPNQYVRKKRLDKAKEILEIGVYPTVKETAMSVGFKSPSYFAKLFYAEFQVIPYNLLSEG